MYSKYPGEGQVPNNGGVPLPDSNQRDYSQQAYTNTQSVPVSSHTQSEIYNQSTYHDDPNAPQESYERHTYRRGNEEYFDSDSTDSEHQPPNAYVATLKEGGGRPAQLQTGGGLNT